MSVDLPFHDRNQGNIAHAKVGIAQATELQEFARSTVADRRRQRLRRLSDQREGPRALSSPATWIRRKQSLDITTYVYQQGSGTLLDLLDAERTYRTTQLAYRQALAAYMTSVQQINLAVGRQVMQ